MSALEWVFPGAAVSEGVTALTNSCRIALLVITVLTGASAGAQSPSVAQSVYTDLAGARCASVKAGKDTGASVLSCQGISGFRLLVEDDDDRMSVTVIDSAGRRHPLNYWDVVTHSFSSLGKKAEWRVTRQGGKVAPFALIVRVNASEEIDGKSKPRSFLAVAKLSADQTCVTDAIADDAHGNEAARAAADAAASKPCLKEK